MKNTIIETVSGKLIDLVNPAPSDIAIEDIAWALSRMPRYVGHTISEIPYTVGQHSLAVMRLLQHVFKKNDNISLRRSLFNHIDALDIELRDKCYEVYKSPLHVSLLMEALMHDASEAYIVDVPTPLKQVPGFREVYLEIEDRMMAAIRQCFSMGPLRPEYHELVKWADQAALTIEAYHLMKSRGANWTRLLHLDITALQLFEPPKPNIDVYQEFIDTWNEITTYP